LFARLAQLAPGAASFFPRSLSYFYAFVGEQDLVDSHPGLKTPTRAQSTAVTSALRRVRAEPDADLLGVAAALALGRLAEAARLGRRAVARRPGERLAALLFAAALWLRSDRQGRRDLAAQALRWAERAAGGPRPGADALLLRAQARLEIEDYARGLKDLAAAAVLRPKDPGPRIGRVEALADAGRTIEALAELASLSRLVGCRWWLIAQRARVLAMGGRGERALADFDAALKSRPRHGGLRAWRAETLRKLGRTEEAVVEFDAALRLDPDYAFSWEARGRLRLAQGRPDLAACDLTRALTLNPRRNMAYAWRAQAWLACGRPRAAWKDLDACHPLNLETTWVAAPGLDRREAFRLEVLQRAPRGRWAALARSRIAAVSGREAAALAPLAVAARGGDDASAWARAWLGWCLLRLGRRARAGRELAAAGKRLRSPLPRAWLGRLRAEQGRLAEALELWSGALRSPRPALAEDYLRRAETHERLGEPEKAACDYEVAAAYGAAPPAARAAVARLRAGVCA
jgi:tetratricopeptide (TPR) repeat protein